MEERAECPNCKLRVPVADLTDDGKCPGCRPPVTAQQLPEQAL